MSFKKALRLKWRTELGLDMMEWLVTIALAFLALYAKWQTKMSRSARSKIVARLQGSIPKLAAIVVWAVCLVLAAYLTWEGVMAPTLFITLVVSAIVALT